MLGYILSHDAKLQEIQNAHNTSRSSQKKTTEQTRRKLISFFFFKMSIERLLPPSLRGLQPFLGLLQVFFSQAVSIQNANAAAQPLAAQQGICYSPRSLWGKRFVPLFLLFTEGTVCSGHFSWLRKYWWRNDSGFKEGCG